MLRQRLGRQGLSLAVPLLAAVLTSEAEAATRTLIQATLRGVIGNLPERVAILAAEALGVSAMMKLKIGLVLGLILGVAAGGVAMLTPRAPMPSLPQAERPAEPPKAEKNAAARIDHYGDPLPEGAVARLGTLRFRLDTLRVDQVAFAPDSKTMAAAWHGGLTFFDAANGKHRKNIKPVGTGVSRLAYSPDGKRLLVYARIPMHAPPDKDAVQTWDVATERKIAETELLHVCWLGWSAKGQPQAVTLEKGEIVYHELETGRKQRLPAKDLFDPPLVGQCRCVAANNLLAASGPNGAIHIWDLTSGEERFTLRPGVYVMSLALSADGRRLASVSRDAANKNPVQLWDTTTGKPVRSLAPGYEVLFAPDGKTLVATAATEMRFWDAATGRQISRIHTESYRFGPAFAFSPDSKTFATTESQGGAIQLWDVAGGTRKRQPQGHAYRVTGISFSPDGKRVASCATLDGTIRIWDAANGEQLVRIHHHGWARDAAFAADGRTLYSCWTDDKVYFDDAADGHERAVLTVQDPDRPKVKPDGLSLHLSDDRARLTIFHTADEKGMEMLVTGWDVATRKQLYHRRRVEDAYWNALSADGRMLAAAYSGPPERGGMPGRSMAAGPMHLEDMASGEKLLTFPHLAGQTVPLAFSPDGRLLVSYTNVWRSDHGEQTLRLWEVLTATELRAFPMSPFDRKAVFSPNGRLLALTTPQGEILVWDVRRASEHRRFRGLGTHVTSLAFSPDNRRLISGLSNSTLLVWDIPPCDNPRAEHSAEEVARAWNDLGVADAPRAFRARWLLAAAPDKAMALLSKRLHAAPSPNPQRVRRLLADLESEQFAVREKAQEELAALGDLAAPALRRSLEQKPSLEMRRRVQTLLERLQGPVTQPELLQALRAVAVLEDIGTTEARQLLEQLGKGAPEARLTREAKDSLQRLKRRPGK